MATLTRNNERRQLGMDRSCRRAEPRPILRWAGGKSGIVRRLIRLLPSHWNTFVEPMVGGGALFFRLGSKPAILSDINGELINFYKVLRDQRDELIEALMSLTASTETYYDLRCRRPRKPIQRAIRFAYLNRLCWNGLYRVNREGAFNVPIGDRLPRSLWNRSAFETAAQSLQGVRLICADFSKVLSRVQSGAFVFLDPPYPKGAQDALGFNRYSPGQFSLHDHRRLSRWLDVLTDRGAKVMLVLSDAEHLTALYPSYLRRVEVRTKSLISGNGHGRREVDEVILTNYSPSIRGQALQP